MKLLDHASGDTASVDFVHLGQGSTSGMLNLYIAGDIGGGQLIVEAKLPDGSGYVPIAGQTHTAAGMHVIEAGPFVGRVRLAGSTAPDLSVWQEPDSYKRRMEVAGR